jgi:short-subunit dehydrogenase
MGDPSAKATALVTGGSRGIGAIYCRPSRKAWLQPHPDGTQRKALSARLTKETGRSVTPLRADLSDKADLAKVEGILRDSQAITMLVNNAGIGSITALLNTEVDKTEMIALNITALTRLTYAAPQAFVARSAGTIINIASVVGISPETMVCMAQPRRMSLRSAFPCSTSLLTKASAIQAELPGVTATNLWEIAGFPWQKLPASIVMSPENMVDAALVGLDQGELVTIPGLHDEDEWTHFEAARRALSQRFGNSTPAPRYGIGLPQSA